MAIREHLYPLKNTRCAACDAMLDTDDYREAITADRHQINVDIICSKCNEALRLIVRWQPLEYVLGVKTFVVKRDADWPPGLV